MPTFLPGRELNRRFYAEAVRPLLAEYFPDLPYAAALLGPGSEVLGFDSVMSTDHDWGLRLLLLLHEADSDQVASIDQLLSRRLPSQFLGHLVPDAQDTGDTGNMSARQPSGSPISHAVLPATLRQLTRTQLGIELDQPLRAVDWLLIPSQALRALADGAVYHDGIGELTALRERLAWYPYDVWLYLLASGWQRIGQEEHLMPRAGYAGDELGSAIIGSRLIRDVMHLSFLIERYYAPYPKWLGTAFKQLACAEEMWPALWRAQRASTWQEREEALSQAYILLANMHNALGITEQLPVAVSPFYDRPFQVIHGDLFAAALAARITDPEVKRIAARGLIGNIDQVTDNTDVRGHAGAALRHVYEG